MTDGQEQNNRPPLSKGSIKIKVKVTHPIYLRSQTSVTLNIIISRSHTLITGKIVIKMVTYVTRNVIKIKVIDTSP